MGVRFSKALLAITGGVPLEVAEIAYALPSKTAVSNPGATSQATAGPAAVAGTQYVCTGISASLACGATAQTPLSVNLRDSTTGVGNVIWSGVLSAPVNGSASLPFSDLCIPGVVGQAMTLEFSAGGVAASLEAVTLTYVALTT